MYLRSQICADLACIAVCGCPRVPTDSIPMCCQGAIPVFIAVEEPSHRTSPSRSRQPCRLTTPATRHTPPRPLVRLVVPLPLLTPPSPICQRLSLRYCLSCLSSVRLVFASPHFSRPHLLSAGASAEITSLLSLPIVVKPNSMRKALKLTNQACKFEYVFHLTHLSSTTGETEAFNETFVARITF